MISAKILDGEMVMVLRDSFFLFLKSVKKGALNQGK